MFVVALFLKAQLWKQCKYPLIGEWINKLRHFHTVRDCLATKEQTI
jgi:hypothetical protein